MAYWSNQEGKSKREGLCVAKFSFLSRGQAKAFVVNFFQIRKFWDAFHCRGELVVIDVVVHERSMKGFRLITKSFC